MTMKRLLDLLCGEVLEIIFVLPHRRWPGLELSVRLIHFRQPHHNAWVKLVKACQSLTQLNQIELNRIELNQNPKMVVVYRL